MSPAIRAAIVDDEALARERIRTLLKERPEIDVVAECSGGRDALEALADHPPDLLFLDVQMPDLNGFEVLDSLERLPAVVFVTAYDEYALRAFDVHALDYLLKPIDPERFQRAVDHVVAALKKPQPDGLDSRLTALLGELRSRASPLDRLVVKSDGRLLLLRPGEIDWIEADGKYARLHVGKESHTVRQPLRELAERLKARGFVRVHRSAIVNVDRIRELQSWFHGEYVVILRDGTRLTSSAAHSDDLHRLVERGL